MILAFWLECFLKFHRKAEKSGSIKQQRDEKMIWYVNNLCTDKGLFILLRLD